MNRLLRVYIRILRRIGKSLGKISYKLVSRHQLSNTGKKLPFRWPIINKMYLAILFDYLDSLADVFLISYPKCGRTWLRLMIGQALVSNHRIRPKNPELVVDLEELAARYNHITRIIVTHDRFSHSKRILGHGLQKYKKAEELEESKPEYIYGDKKVIFLVRDPRDVIVSYYFQATQRDKNFCGDISTFIRHNRIGIDAVVRFMKMWFDNRNIPQDFLLVRYEDLKRTPYFEFKKILSFLGLTTLSESEIKRIIKMTDFENMKKIEREGKLGFQLRPRDLDNPESYKVRRGEMGGYVNYLSSEDIDYLNSKIKEQLPLEYGYSNGKISENVLAE